MKKNWKSLLVAGGLVLAALPMVACQTGKNGAASSAVMCDKCKTVWVKTSEFATKYVQHLGFLRPIFSIRQS